jgi:hypothetical protein
MQVIGTYQFNATDGPREPLQRLQQRENRPVDDAQWGGTNIRPRVTGHLAEHWERQLELWINFLKATKSADGADKMLSVEALTLGLGSRKAVTELKEMADNYSSDPKLQSLLSSHVSTFPHHLFLDSVLVSLPVGGFFFRRCNSSLSCVVGMVVSLCGANVRNTTRERCICFFWPESSY